MAYPSVSGPYGLVPVKLLSGVPFVGVVDRDWETTAYEDHFLS